MQQICKNCGNLYEGNYCNHCGQKAKVGKLTLRSVLDNWAYGLTNCDTGILFTYKELFTRPGHMLYDYIRGKRVIYFQPFPMLFITAGLYGLLTQILVPQALEETTIKLGDTVTFLERFLKLLTTWIHSSMSFSSIITLPVFAWSAQFTFRNPAYHPFTYYPSQYISAWVYYRLIHTRRYPLQTFSDYLFTITYSARIKYLRKKKYHYNFTEYIFIFAYIACQRLVIGVFVVLPILLYTNNSKLSAMWQAGLFFIYFILLIWDFKQLFRLKTGKAIGKVFFMMFCWLIISLLLILLLAFFIVAVTVLFKYITEGNIKEILELFDDI